MSSANDSTPAEHAKGNYLNRYLVKWSQSDRIQRYAVIGALAGLFILHLLLIALRRRDQSWIVRKIKRAEGTYLVPHGGIAFSLGMGLFYIVYMATCATDFGFQAMRDLSIMSEGLFLTKLSWIPLMYAIWMSVTTSQWAALLTLFSTGKLSRLPPPWLFHCYVYGVLGVWLAGLVPVFIWASIQEIDFFDQLRAAVKAMEGSTDGSSSINDSDQLQQLYSGSAHTHFQRVTTIERWVLLIPGLLAILFHTPFCFLLAQQLHRARSSLRQTAPPRGRSDNRPQQTAPPYAAILYHAVIINLYLWTIHVLAILDWRVSGTPLQPKVELARQWVHVVFGALIAGGMLLKTIKLRSMPNYMDDSEDFMLLAVEGAALGRRLSTCSVNTPAREIHVTIERYRHESASPNRGAIPISFSNPFQEKS